MIDTRTTFIRIFVSGLIISSLAILILAPPVLTAPVAVETKTMSSPAADPFVGFVSVGPKHEFEPVYRVLEPGACPLLAHRILILNYANYDSLVIETLGFAGSKCQDVKVRKSLSVNGVTLGYALGEGTRFAWNIEFLKWEAWDAFIVRSAKKNFRFQLNDDGRIFAEPIGNQDVGRSTPLDRARDRQDSE